MEKSNFSQSQTCPGANDQFHVIPQRDFSKGLISNASDAIDKLYFKSLTDSNVDMGRGDFEIIIKVDKDNRTITVSDNGCGMNAEQLESNLGTIAHSGTLRFKTSEEKLDDMDLIGQFGIGFYAAFMVSEKVTVTSLAYGEDQAYRWNQPELMDIQ